MNSNLAEQIIEKREIQMLICGGGLRADENWMSAETSWVHDAAGGQNDMAGSSGSSSSNIFLGSNSMIVSVAPRLLSMPGCCHSRI